MKSIYGMENEHEAVAGEEQLVKDDEQQKECLICLDAPKDTLIMPCGHFCICKVCA